MTKIEVEVEYKIVCTEYIELNMSEDELYDMSDEELDELFECKIDLGNPSSEEFDDFTGFEINTVRVMKEDE